MNFRRLVSTDTAPTTILVRLMVGVVFLSEGIQKFVFPDTLGEGRFEKIGLPASGFLGPFVGTFEVVCGSLVILGFLTRLAAIPLIAIMIVAIAATKAQVFTENGFWEMMHASRTDWAMLLGSIFLLAKGGGRWSVDHLL